MNPVPPSISIAAERPDTPDARALIEELDDHLEALYPRQSRHGYSVDKLIAQQVAFFVLRSDGVPAACGGVQMFGTEYGEIKRMYVRPQFRGLGLARKILAHLARVTASQGVGLLRLETGIHQTEAIRLYESWGFTQIGPFGEYRADPLSRFYEKAIDPRLLEKS
jgi:putative acetyltransferase